MKARCLLSTTSPYILAILTAVLAAVFPSHAWGQWIEDRIPVCAAAGDQDWDTIVSDGQGGAIVAWRDERGSSPDIYAQRITSRGCPCSCPVPVSYCVVAIMFVVLGLVAVVSVKEHAMVGNRS